MQSAKMQRQAGEYQAAQLEAQGKADQAAASIETENIAQEKTLLLSRARTVAAASGGGQDIGLLADIEEEGTLRQMRATWGGQEAAAGRNAQADAARFTAQQGATATQFKAYTGILSEAESLFSKYG